MKDLSSRRGPWPGVGRGLGGRSTTRFELIERGGGVSPRPLRLGFYGWGLASDGSTIREAELSSGAVSVPSGTGPRAAVRLGVVAAATPPGQDVRYVRVDVSVIVGNKCNYHAMVTPSPY